MIGIISRVRPGGRIGFICVLVLSAFLSTIHAEEGIAEREELREPVYRVTKVDVTDKLVGEDVKAFPEADQQPKQPEKHPLDPCLEMARRSLDRIRDDIRDYTCTIVRRERVNGTLLPTESIACKIREPHTDEDGNAVPFSVYMKFRKPRALAGREVIYIEGANNNKLVAHEGGWKGRLTPTVYLAPNGPLAMRGNRYPITEVGVRRLTEKLVEKGVRDRARGTCEVKFLPNVKINKRGCTRLQIVHPERLPHLDFHQACIFVDDETGIPIRYEARDWPSTPGGDPPKLEEYTYLHVKLNVGLTDKDFESATYGF